MPAPTTSRFPTDSGQPQQHMGSAPDRSGRTQPSDSHPKRTGPASGSARKGRAARREATAPTLFPMVLPPDHAASHGTSAASQPPPPPGPAGLRSRKPAASASADVAPPAELVGIARLAASSPLAQEKRSTEYFLLPVRSILNRCDSKRMPFEWTINPYRGCEFGCKYCYARYTHEFMELAPAEFEKKIFAKQNAGPLLARDLATKIRPVGVGFDEPPEHIAIGTATDPYQPAEREFGVMRAILEQLATREGLSLSITTKSDQVVRDLDLLRRIAERSSLAVNVSITTPRPRLARMIEPRAPRPDLRFAAIRKLRDAGIHAGVFVMPILPGLTDRKSDLEKLAQMAVEARAEWFSGGVLWLMQSSLTELLKFLDEKFPRLAADYRKWYSRSAYAPDDYKREVSARVGRLRAKYNLGFRPYAESPAERPATAQPQLALALAPVSCKPAPAAAATNTAA